ncbi:hypothetical protein XELAEV_18029936mg [Xenopus laevis]|uniref:Uncharacterized protein n=1 Tax=Xenopus laevis TaxID=8355 RepID=A0A974HI83_XENLA|nr:hypothetical protein XELAEV_18029936mg [Xenopus laevis]
MRQTDVRSRHLPKRLTQNQKWHQEWDRLITKPSNPFSPKNCLAARRLPNCPCRVTLYQPHDQIVKDFPPES